MVEGGGFTCFEVGGLVGVGHEAFQLAEFVQDHAHVVVILVEYEHLERHVQAQDSILAHVLTAVVALAGVVRRNTA